MTSGGTGWRMRSAAGREAVGQLGLDGVLQCGEAVVAQLPGQADDRGGARPGLVGQLGDGAEGGDQLRALQYDVQPPAAPAGVSAGPHSVMRPATSIGPASLRRPAPSPERSYQHSNG